MNGSSYYEEDTKALGTYILEITKALEVDYYKLIYKALHKDKEALTLYRRINKLYEKGVACSQAIMMLKRAKKLCVNQKNE